jgi:uncharacterized repeat protein (TIGR01451 family)
MRYSRPVLSLCCLCVFILAIVTLGITPALAQGPEDPTTPPVEITPPEEVTPADEDTPLEPEAEPDLGESVSAEALSSGTFQITFDEMGYGERVLESPYGVAEYTLRLPEGWELRTGSFVRLDFSYKYNHDGIPETSVFPPLFGDVSVFVDEQSQRTFPIDEPAVGQARVRVPLPTSLFNDPTNRTHTIKVVLDGGYICEVPHTAALTLHTTSLFSLSYDQLPITPDLAVYPRPFQQRSFEPDQVRFVLPPVPTEMELTGAVATAAKLGDLAYDIAISGTTGFELSDRLEALEANEFLHEHLIVVGTPESNEVIVKLSQLGVLPLPLRERQLSLASDGPAAVVPGSIVTYSLTLTNTSGGTLSALSLVDSLPAHTQMVSCNPVCSEAVEGEISWSIPSLGVGEALNYTLAVRVSEMITNTAVDNIVTLLDAASGPMNASTLDTVVSLTPLTNPSLASSGAGQSRFFFVEGDRAVPENDGIIQELVSPWDPTRAILVVTGLSDEAVYKAGQAMGFESQLPGMEGPFALVRDVRSLPESPPESQVTDLTFADLGYGDRILTGFFQEISYPFDVPPTWYLAEEAHLDLRFRHSQLLDYESSFLTVLFNDKPVTTITLSDETSMDGKLDVKLPGSQVRPGRKNRIAIQSSLYPYDRCAGLNVWLLISDASWLHLEHEEQEVRSLDLDFYPYPFDRPTDLTRVLFMLPPEPQLAEWEEILQLAAALGEAAGGPNLAPAVTWRDDWTEAELANYHVIAVGRPSRNPVLRQVNSQLPQPFQPDSDEIEQQLEGVVFRLPPGLNLGLVQLIPSPWNEAHAFVAVTGTTDDGVQRAASVLAERHWALKGDLAFIKDGEVTAVDTRGLMRSGLATVVATAVPEMTPVPTPADTPETPESGSASGVSPSQSGTRKAGIPGWLIPVVGLNGLIVIAIIAFVFWRARQQRV